MLSAASFADEAEQYVRHGKITLRSLEQIPRAGTR